MSEMGQVDILTEVINVGIGEAAQALSELVDARVNLTVPYINVLKAAEIDDFVRQELPNWSVFIAQQFEGAVKGNAVLVYSEPCSLDLLDALLAGAPRTVALDAAARDTLQEIGNIILGACISVFGDVLDERLAFTIPKVSLEASKDFFSDLTRDFTESGVAIAVRSEISVEGRAIRGLIFVLLGFSDFEKVVASAKKRWLP